MTLRSKTLHAGFWGTVKIQMAERGFHTGRRGGRDAATKCPELPEPRGGQEQMLPWRGNGLRHLDFRLLVSRTVRECICVVSSRHVGAHSARAVGRGCTHGLFGRCLQDSQNRFVHVYSVLVGFYFFIRRPLFKRYCLFGICAKCFCDSHTVNFYKYLICILENNIYFHIFSIGSCRTVSPLSRLKFSFLCSWFL
jgi:hypothetical protein